MSSAALHRLRDRTRAFGGSHFVRNVATLATGVASAQAISLAFAPFLTRLYGPEAFGALAAFTAVVNIITPLATLGYANAIVMPATEEGATAVARLSLVCAAVVAPVVLIAVTLFQVRLATWTGLESAPGLLYLIPIYLVVVALLSVADQMAIREGLFKAKALAYVSSTLLVNIGKLAGGFLAPSGLVLILLLMVSKMLNYLMLLARVPRQGAFEVRRWLGTDGIRHAAFEQRDFMRYRMPQGIINALSFGFPVLALSALFSTSVAGQYSIATLVLGAPIMLLGQSVLEVFFPRITEVVRTSPTSAVTHIQRATLGMLLIGAVPFGIIALWGDVIFPLVFGEEWLRAGEYTRWIALWMASVLATRPAVAAMPALRLQRELLVYEVVITFVRIASLLVAASLGSDLTAVAVFALVNAVGYGVLLLVVFRRALGIKREQEYA
ncbi:lipopolysaccharide biosynthesis protein [Halomonas saccharevitans]|uniref:Membrane protein involved in the export of O-antigen and teichoic acid n=1 Tax=Halomonas saccharevitans TaxID=416872 RepID=A0A1I7CK17_9GAMM|nr:oligosaccharide flippase family protein [Halomonas saccharevitans]SFT99780.1 Membrane protein involved in the export of O-antigen and teichoic acid [Halomonas saccharevitans]